MRVALIGNRFDLGSVPVFWRKPQPYAKFLSQELNGPAPYTNRVLVVMPSGYGLSRNGKELPAERRRSTACLRQTRATRTSPRRERAPVRRLAALHGIEIQTSSPGSGGNRERLIVVGASLAAVAAAAGAVLWRRRRAGAPG